jgi:hypothetical protein
MGYVVENDAIAPDPDKVAALYAYVRHNISAIVEFPKPS